MGMPGMGREGIALPLALPLAFTLALPCDCFDGFDDDIGLSLLEADGLISFLALRF